MKLKFTFLFLFASFLIFAQNEFVTLWKPNIPTSGSGNTKIYFPGSGTNYTIYWEEVGNSAHNGTITNVSGTEITPKLIDFGAGLTIDAEYLVKVTDGNGVFTNFNGASVDNKKLLEVKQWGNIKWTTMQSAFYNCINLDVTATDSPDLSNCSKLNAMFYQCTNLKGNASFNLWDTSTITNMEGMFIRAINFNAPIGNWNMSNVTSMSAMFNEANTFNQDIGNWNTSKVIYMSHMFSEAFAFNKNIGNWDTSKVIGMTSMFSNASVFDQNIGNWNTSNVTDLSDMFKNATEFNQNIANWDVSKVVNMSFMFSEASEFDQNIGSWNTSNVSDFSSMFSGSNFNQDISNWDTSKATNMSSMFSSAIKFNQNIGNWDTSKVSDMTGTFSSATNFNGDISNWNTSEVIDMSAIFYKATNFNQNIGNWDTSKVTDMTFMFFGATKFNQDIGNWNTSEVTSFSKMFFNATSFNQSLEKWNLKNVTNIQAMLQNTNLSCQNYDETLIGWANNIDTHNNLLFSDINLIYSSQGAVSARNYLINTKGWTISGDTYNATCALATDDVNAVKIQVHPNPTSDYIYVENVKNNADWELYDIQGKLVKKDKYRNNPISLINLPSGIYIFIIPSENFTKKLIMK